MTGRIVLVGTPIGNLGDLSPRAAELLARADVVACEDTRRTGKLFELSGIERSGRFVVLNDHTETERIGELVALVAGGSTVAVVSDAGMPGISDPGQRLVAAAVDAEVAVEVIPGPSAVLSALVLSGMPAGRFCFEGFLPRKGPARRARLAAISTDVRTTVLYESPHRVAATLADLAEVAGADRDVVVARELTKLHEELWRGTAADGAAHFGAEAPRGEVTIVVRGAEDRSGEEVDDDLIASELAALVDSGATTRDAIDAVTERHGAARRRVYDIALGRQRRDLTGE
ncbi:MAG TPA: 16S rRNA (cytidine(1402)-2'-O)-methyltransferase [Acidimicrobiales bacterium]|nr:16S rRNA (cytidine(1402)-2'-O)-methyltransferase [Acidimicrobiales bacterium]